MTVDVQDINDNGPVFTNTPYLASVNEVCITNINNTVFTNTETSLKVSMRFVQGNMSKPKSPLDQRLCSEQTGVRFIQVKFRNI